MVSYTYILYFLENKLEILSSDAGLDNEVIKSKREIIIHVNNDNDNRKNVKVNERKCFCLFILKQKGMNIISHGHTRLKIKACRVTSSIHVNLPTTPSEMITQSRNAIEANLKRGVLFQNVKFLLPVNEKQFNFLAIEAVDYPCSLRDEFDSCCSLTKAVLQQLTDQDKFQERRLDDGGVEGEPCSAIYPESKEIVAIVFPTADRLNDLKKIANKSSRPLLIVNSQWNDSGQVISDFGFGPWKKAAEQFLSQFKESYILKEQRVGSPGSVDPNTGQRYTTGAVIRVLLCSPNEYKVFAMSSEGSHQLIGTFDHQPEYQELENLLQGARNAELEIFTVAQETSSAFYKPSRGDADQPIGNIEESVSEYEIDAMDATTLRQLLSKRGLPTSGKIAKLKERLKEAMLTEISES